MINKLKILLVVVLVVASSVCYNFYSSTQATPVSDTDSVASTSTPIATTSPTTISTSPSLHTIATSSPNTVATHPSNATLAVGTSTYPLFVTSNETVLAAMQQLSSTTNFTFAGKTESGMGIFVTALNGKENSHGSYWFLYINGESASKGISTQTLSPGDRVEWEFESGY